MNSATFRQVVCNGAKEILREMARTIYVSRNSAALPLFWTHARHVEERFALHGFTVRLVDRFEEQAKAVAALHTLAAVGFEWDAADLIRRDCARDVLRDFERVYGRDELNRIVRDLNLPSLN